MAGTYTVNLNASISEAPASAAVSISYTPALSNVGFIGSIQAIGTSDVQIDLGAVGSTPLMVVIQNQDATNYVEVSADSGLANFPQKILPGQVILLAPETGTLYAKAHTASCSIFVLAC